MNASKPRVTIGLPVRNGARFLDQALASLVSQTFTDFEIVVSDNASDDETQKIVLSYARSDPRIRYYRNERDVGAARNFNRTFHLARGEYFRWAAHDDIWHDEHLARCVEALDADPRVVLAYTKVRLIDEEGAVLDPCFDPFELTSPSAAARLHRLLWDLREPHMVFGLTRSRVFAQTRLLRADQGADRLLLAELALLGPWQQVDDVLFLNRRTDSVRSERTRYWWDPSSRGRLMLRTIRLFVNHADAVWDTALPGSQKMFLSADAFARFLVKDYRRVGREIRQAATQGYGIRPWLRERVLGRV
ncbi:MAG: glycosyltransferase [Thermoleophilia bacterium]|nr:glycosyltransferase [Thermoleophilia bacterium]